MADLLTHLYVLLPVLDDDKHYWVADDEIDKLMERGGDWLAGHPDRELIVRRYLRHQKQLTTAALSRLLVEEQHDPAGADEALDREEKVIEEKISLNAQRIGAVLAVLNVSTGCPSASTHACSSSSRL